VFSVVTLFIVFAAVIGSTAATAIITYLIIKSRQIPGGGSDRQLIEQVSLLREELIGLTEEVQGLSERVDFTENLLMSGDSSEESSE